MIINFKHLFFVDVSGNFLDLDALQILAQLPFLIALRAQRNRIESAALETMPFLQVLSLSKNQISETCDIFQPILHSLDLNCEYHILFRFFFIKKKSPNNKKNRVKIKLKKKISR